MTPYLPFLKRYIRYIIPPFGFKYFPFCLFCLRFLFLESPILESDRPFLFLRFSFTLLFSIFETKETKRQNYIWIKQSPMIHTKIPTIFVFVSFSFNTNKDTSVTASTDKH